MNIGEGASYEPEDVEEALKDFLERELGFHDARLEEMQRVHIEAEKARMESPGQYWLVF